MNITENLIRVDTGLDLGVCPRMSTPWSTRNNAMQKILVVSLNSNSSPASHIVHCYFYLLQIAYFKFLHL